MRAIILAVTAMCLPAAANAQDQDPCAGWGSLAETIMTKRQIGITMSDMMAVAMKGEENNTMLRSMIIDAYSAPMLTTKDAKIRQLRDFRNQQELNCYKATRNQPRS